ncbi:hypothetical protein TIFTF001_019789 [Ficus carica]|uniref:Uncharacterized protein n=1 Tax=Ficus carica TaxID=3494 RepID=A0AA88ACC4_FICCA|nr:hypothetical protein TIFTF001_019789 [Ficus carica]
MGIGLVRKSGCGKSTAIGLILRFYDVENAFATNILLGKLDALEREVLEAAKAANVHEFISQIIERRVQNGMWGNWGAAIRRAKVEDGNCKGYISEPEHTTIGRGNECS